MYCRRHAPKTEAVGQGSPAVDEPMDVETESTDELAEEVQATVEALNDAGDDVPVDFPALPNQDEEHQEPVPQLGKRTTSQANLDEEPVSMEPPPTLAAPRSWSLVRPAFRKMLQSAPANLPLQEAEELCSEPGTAETIREADDMLLARASWLRNPFARLGVVYASVAGSQAFANAQTKAESAAPQSTASSTSPPRWQAPVYR